MEEERGPVFCFVLGARGGVTVFIVDVEHAVVARAGAQFSSSKGAQRYYYYSMITQTYGTYHCKRPYGYWLLIIARAGRMQN